jgi:hypothetical protein
MQKEGLRIVVELALQQKVADFGCVYSKYYNIKYAAVTSVVSLSQTDEDYLSSERPLSRLWRLK